MRLKKTSRLVQWAYWPEPRDKPIPSQTSVCAFFWRAFVLVPMFTALFCVAIVLTSPAWVPIWAIGKMLPANTSDRIEARLKGRATNSVLAQRLLAAKRRVCPIIELAE